MNRKVQIQLPRSLKRKRKISTLMMTLKVIIYPKFSFLQSEFNYCNITKLRKQFFDTVLQMMRKICSSISWPRNPESEPR